MSERNGANKVSDTVEHALKPGGGKGGEAEHAPVERLLKAVKSRASGRHVVVIRGYPDPDSLASAWAHVTLAESVGVECDIAHLPMVSRAENRAMVNLLEVPLVRLSGLESLERYAALSLVDANALELPKAVGIPCVSIVDHHSVSGVLDADFVDIRSSVGATSTIYTEYLFSDPARLLDGTAVNTRLATALAYGIRSDTDDLLHATPKDLLALGELIARVDADLLGGLLHYSIPASAMRIIKRSLDELRIEGTWAFAGVGEVRPHDRDAIGQAADFLMRRDGIRTVLTFGLVDGWIDGSLRTVDPAIDPATFLRDAFGIGPLGLPYGGGRKGKGGFQIPLGPLQGCPDRRALWHVCKETIEAAVRREIGTSRDDEEHGAGHDA